MARKSKGKFPNRSKPKPQSPFKRSSANIKTAVLALVLLVVLILLAKTISLATDLNKPKSPELGINKQFVWDGKSAVNVAILSNEKEKAGVSIVSLNPTGEKIVVLHIADSTFIDLPKGYGEWKLGSVYNLGQEENPPIGAQLVKLSLSKLLGLPIDGVVIISGSTQPTEELITQFRKNSLSRLTLLPKIKTDMTTLEVINFTGALASVRSDKISSLDFERSNITESKLLPDSSRVLGVDSAQLDLFIREKMADLSIIEEGTSIGVFNATDHPGLAQEAVRIITNMGGSVYVVSNTTNPIEKSTVIVLGTKRGDKKTLTQQRLSEVFAPHCLKEICETADPKIMNSRAMINIVIGEDFYNYWYLR